MMRGVVVTRRLRPGEQGRLQLMPAGDCPAQLLDEGFRVGWHLAAQASDSGERKQVGLAVLPAAKQARHGAQLHPGQRLVGLRLRRYQNGVDRSSYEVAAHATSMAATMATPPGAINDDHSPCPGQYCRASRTAGRHGRHSLPYSTETWSGRQGRGMEDGMIRVRGKATTGGISVGLVVLAGLLVTGCGDLRSGLDNTTGSSSDASSPATPAAAADGASGPVAGPGPQSRYHVQAQPAPGTCHYVVLNATAGQYLPDPHCTPGATNPRVTQADLASTVCKSGYTATIRPPAGITGPEKKASEAAYGFKGKGSTTEYDHLISLELGGDPNSPLNLWPEPNKASAVGVNNPKDRVEDTLKALVCNAVHGKPYLPLVKAQYLISTNWTTAVATAEKELVS
jgi:hypothetical protein